jgi:hypothetical protein
MNHNWVLGFFHLNPNLFVAKIKILPQRVMLTESGRMSLNLRYLVSLCQLWAFLLSCTQAEGDAIVIKVRATTH